MGLSGGSAVRVTGTVAEPGSRQAAGSLWQKCLGLQLFTPWYLGNYWDIFTDLEKGIYCRKSVP